VSNLRTVPPDFAADTVAAIDGLLASIKSEQHVAIPLAIESGSRAWGFPSPDSDYDCRFVYVRRIDDYLSPWQQRDVIETPLVGDLDVNGWDIGKAIKLMLKGNAVITEWLRSPIVYTGDVGFRDGFLALANRIANAELIARHYLHLGERQRHTYFGDGKDVPLKKIFYALRPAATLRWMRMHPGHVIAPMHFPTLMAECEPSADVAAFVTDLMQQKAATRELGTAPLPSPIAGFIDGEFAMARERLTDIDASIPESARAEATAFFRDTVRRFG
jgi:uncharacterized protein